MTSPWCVKITYLPAGITNVQLANKFRVPLDEIYIPANQQGNTYYAWVNGFRNEEDAIEFTQRWDRGRIFSTKMKCKAVPASTGSNRQMPWSNSNRFNSPQEQRTGPRRVPRPTTSNQRDGDESLERSSDKPCRKGIDCFNNKCKLDHPDGWEACDNGADCEDFFCKANHPFDRYKPCPDGHDCDANPCNYLHPKPGMKECIERVQCRLWKCPDWHPKKRPKDCKNAEKCHNFNCRALHPPDWSPCRSGDECVEFSCKLNHPPTRPSPCDQSNACGNFYCDSLHPIEWDPCEKGVDCTDLSCPHTSHPTERRLSLDSESSSKETLSSRVLKTIEQRNLERQQVHLPILDSKEEFCRRLEEERVLVVTAETGSGKSTQLPQYAAEYFGGLVVCTQPRVIAAISLARRVANEYDGMSIGRSVGYRVGITSSIKGHNRVPGTDIVFMTDGALIQESLEDDQLSNVRVLIIDEAHERSLNTDIVMGIAKLLLKNRPRNFYVVISSATIEPSKFLNFFDRADIKPLRVPGRVYDVSVDYSPQSTDSMEQHAVSTLLELYDQHQGTTLVFLPGQREIEQAIELFNRSLPPNSVALPLYSTLSPEEQSQVLQFDEGENGERRMVVFCTNIAETSLTIKNTRLVIDSGLAKEPYFNRELRLTTIEIKLISQASADQRKGRAGRTAPGHCVRLYPADALTRPHIEPALLRSSLDLVFLQLIYLNFNPLEFPFLDPPDRAIIQASLDTLQALSCIDAHHDLTRRGELFVKLNFDPRYSSFLIDAYLEHEPILELATIIVAILTAPGSLFSMGITDEDKKESKKRITTHAKDHESDLLYFASLYKGWCSVGAIDSTTHTCPICRTVCNTGNICRPCRAAHSAMRGLNNKILNLIENVYDVSVETIRSQRWQLNPRSIIEANESEIIGAKLYKYFPEHHGQLVVPHLPKKGAHLSASNIRANISDLSAYMQRQRNNPQFIAMSITQLPGGRYIIERLHPFCPLAEPNQHEENDDQDEESA